MFEYTKEIRNSILEHAIGKLESAEGVYGCGLHNHCFNTDYFMVHRHNAVEFLGGHAFDAIDDIAEYERDNFGEVITDFSEPEKVVNMLAYILGEELLQKSNHLQSCWDGQLTTNDLEKIESELKQ